MSWLFRKRVKIASGLHFNISKSGVSTSIGPKGAKLNIGSRGATLYAGIPGTGLYSRRKIYSVSQLRDRGQNLSLFDSRNIELNKNKGCFKSFITYLLFVLGAIIFLLILLNIDKSQNNLNITYMFSLFAIICFLIFAILMIRKYLRFSLKSSSEERLNKDIEALRGIIIETTDTLKKKILNNHLGVLIKQNADINLKPSVDKWSKRVEKNSNSKNKEQLNFYKEQYDSAIAESKSLILMLDDDISDAYLDFCSYFKKFSSCSKIWRVLISTANTDIKSSAYTLVKRESVNLKTEIFDMLSFPDGVPCFPSSNGRKIYLYPKFIIEGTTIYDFDVLPFDKVDMNYKSTRFIEEDKCPTDAKQVDTTYRYVNKNGSPDRRYSYNPAIPICLYGDITLQPYGKTFEGSNNEAAINLYDSFQTLKLSNTSEIKNSKDNKGSDDSSIIQRNISFDFTPDSLLNDAANLVVTQQNASLSLLQRRMAIGYNRANRILDQLESLGIIASQTGTSSRKVLVTTILELNEILEYFHKKQRESGKITEEYFEDLLSAAKRLYEYGGKLAKNKAFCKVVNDSVSANINWNGKKLTEPKDKIPALVWADVLNCYLGLGHKIDISSNEGLGLLIYNILALTPDFEIKYSSLDLLRSELKSSFEEFIGDAAVSMKGNSELFVIEFCLRRLDNNMHNQYVVLLYRFASLLAKADKNISEKESSWLNKIMALKIAESDEDCVKSIKSANDNLAEKGKSMENTPTNAIKELESLIGLNSVKSEISSLVNYIKVQKLRAEKGLKVAQISLHYVFTGNPGTGKTSVARIVAEIYKELGLLSKGHLVETDRSGLVAEYVGQTAIKTNKIIDSALDGVLFIDEAYSLAEGGNSDYGKEAIATLLKRMEDDRDRLVVILAGYTEEMMNFFESNPGLQSRFSRNIKFPDYSVEELYHIFCLWTKKYEYILADDAQKVLKDFLKTIVVNKDRSFGNGRFVRNLFEKIIENQANRLSAEATITAESLATIEAEDVQNSLK